MSVLFLPAMILLISTVAPTAGVPVPRPIEMSKGQTKYCFGFIIFFNERCDPLPPVTAPCSNNTATTTLPTTTTEGFSTTEPTTYTPSTNPPTNPPTTNPPTTNPPTSPATYPPTTGNRPTTNPPTTNPPTYPPTNPPTTNPPTYPPTNPPTTNPPTYPPTNPPTTNPPTYSPTNPPTTNPPTYPPTNPPTTNPPTYPPTNPPTDPTPTTSMPPTTSTDTSGTTEPSRDELAWRITRGVLPLALNNLGNKLSEVDKLQESKVFYAGLTAVQAVLEATPSPNYEKSETTRAVLKAILDSILQLAYPTAMKDNPKFFNAFLVYLNAALFAEVQAIVVQAFEETL